MTKQQARLRWYRPERDALDQQGWKWYMFFAVRAKWWGVKKALDAKQFWEAIKND